MYRQQQVRGACGGMREGPPGGARERAWVVVGSSSPSSRSYVVFVKENFFFLIEKEYNHCSSLVCSSCGVTKCGIGRSREAAPQEILAYPLIKSR
jgi:hypothetical protein